MNVTIGNKETGSFSVNVAENESALWQEVGKTLLNLTVFPNIVRVVTPYGDAELSVNKRGTFKKDGVSYPSMYVVPNYNNIKGLPSSHYEEKYLTCINPESNNYKFYHLKPSDSGIGATYGRIGSQRGEAFGVKDLQTPYQPYLFWIRYYEKLSKGYVDQTDVYLKNNARLRVSKKDDEPKDKDTKVSKKAIQTNADSLALYKLLRARAKQYVSQHLVQTSDSITKNQVQTSKRLYRELCERKTLNGFNKKLMQLMQVSPRKCRYVTDLLARSEKDFPEIINREENLISAMEALVTDSNATVTTTEDCFEAMGIEVYPATDKQIEQVKSHLSDNLKARVKKVYRVIPQAQQKRFNAYLKDNGIKTVKQLWHGSKTENWFSIIVNSLQLRPNAAITGKMFGQGIYFAPSSEKSWNYTSYRGTYWAKGTENCGYMGLYATAYGDPLDVTSPGDYSGQVRAQGKNCVHAHTGNYLRNDEIIYYSENAMVLNYIVAFE